MRFATAPGYTTGEQFFTYLRDSFDTLYAEGQAGRAKMFSIGLHCRLIGRPGKIAGLQALPRLCKIAQRRLVPAPHRHRRALGKNPSATSASTAPRR